MHLQACCAWRCELLWRSERVRAGQRVVTAVTTWEDRGNGHVPAEQHLPPSPVGVRFHTFVEPPLPRGGPTFGLKQKTNERFLGRCARTPAPRLVVQ